MKRYEIEMSFEPLKDQEPDEMVFSSDNLKMRSCGQTETFDLEEEEEARAEFKKVDRQYLINKGFFFAKNPVIVKLVQWDNIEDYKKTTSTLLKEKRVYI